MVQVGGRGKSQKEHRATQSRKKTTFISKISLKHRINELLLKKTNGEGVGRKKDKERKDKK